ACRGDLLIFCDDDRIATQGFVRDHLAAHEAASRSDSQPDSRPIIALGRQKAALTLWSRDWNVSAQTVIDLLARRPELAGPPAHPGAGRVSVDAVRDRLDDVVAVHGVAEPWWEQHVVPILDAFGPDMDGFAFPWTAGVTGNLSVSRALAEQVALFDER